MKKSKIAIIAGIALLVIFLFLVIAAGSVKHIAGPEDKLRDNLYFGGLNISGLSREAAETKIKQEFQAMEEKGIIFNYADHQLTIAAQDSTFDADISSQNFQYNREEIAAVLSSYKQPAIWTRWWQKIVNSDPVIISPAISVNEDKIRTAVSDSFPDSAYAAVDAAFIFADNGIGVTPEKLGKQIDWEKLFADLQQELTDFKKEPITIRTKTAYPEISERDLGGLESEADQLTSASLTLVYEEKKIPVNREDIASWLAAKKENGRLKLSFSPERLTKYLQEKIAPTINVAPQNPRFEIKNGKVYNWQLGKDGAELDAAGSAAKIIKEYAIENKQAKKITLLTKTMAAETADSFTVKEIIGTGSSNFSGSSKNRRHNIAVGAAAVHGMIIKPDEEFSLVKTLGEIDASTGYLPELVIKGNKTLPEYGGGLCQVGTTLFRTALASGLPITARQNHSYRVSYYEPAGTDAAVYDPWPDVRFINDTGHNILIQSRIEGNNAYFDFWGTADGRVATTSKPVIYNITKPAPAKIIESEELAPGEKKCTEKAHNGADAYFDYTVIYPEGASTTPLEKIKRFKSHYVPWQEVCLIGKSKASSTPETNNAATTTPTGTTSPATSTKE